MQQHVLDALTVHSPLDDGYATPLDQESAYSHASEEAVLAAPAAAATAEGVGLGKKAGQEGCNRPPHSMHAQARRYDILQRLAPVRHRPCCCSCCCRDSTALLQPGMAFHSVSVNCKLALWHSWTVATPAIEIG